MENQFEHAPATLRRKGLAIASLVVVLTIDKAQVLYSVTKGRGKFTDLRTLGAQGLIDSTLASGQKNDYIFSTEQVE